MSLSNNAVITWRNEPDRSSPASPAALVWKGDMQPTNCPRCKQPRPLDNGLCSGCETLVREQCTGAVMHAILAAIIPAESLAAIRQEMGALQYLPPCKLGAHPAPPADQV